MFPFTACLSLAGWLHLGIFGILVPILAVCNRKMALGSEGALPSGKPTDQTMRWLAACGIIAPILDVLITVWLGALDPNYSHVRQYISELGEAGRPYAAICTAWCLLWGLLLGAFGIAVARGFSGQKGQWLGPGALLVVAISSLVIACFPCDSGSTARTVTGRVHVIVGAWIGMSATTLAPLLSWVAMRRSQPWRSYQTFTLAAGTMLAVVAGWMAVCHYGDLDRSACAVGVAQRL